METLLADASNFKAECCDRDTGTVVSTLCKMPGFNKLPSAFSMFFIQYGELTGENLSQQLKTTSINYKDAEILHTGNHTQPRIDFSLQLSSHGFLFVSFCSLLLEDICNTAILTFLFNMKPLDKGWSLFFIQCEYENSNICKNCCKGNL